jgi:hypothetical protein
MLLAALLVMPVLGCTGTGSASLSTSSYGSSAELALIGSGVYVVENHPHAVFYSDGYYWRWDDGYWHRSYYYDDGFVRVRRSVVPRAVVRIDRPRRYRYYRARANARRRAIIRDRQRADRRDRIRDRQRVERRRDRVRDRQRADQRRDRIRDRQRAEQRRDRARDRQRAERRERRRDARRDTRADRRRDARRDRRPDRRDRDDDDDDDDRRRRRR